MNKSKSKSKRQFVKSAIAAAGVGALAPWAWSADKIRPAADAVLIVVDVQNCFVDGGTLAVSKGAEVVPVINRIAPAFNNIVLTQDWHTPGQASFAGAYQGKKPFETTQLKYGGAVA